MEWVEAGYESLARKTRYSAWAEVAMQRSAWSFLGLGRPSGPSRRFWTASFCIAGSSPALRGEYWARVTLFDGSIVPRSSCICNPRSLEQAGEPRTRLTAQTQRCLQILTGARVLRQAL